MENEIKVILVGLGPMGKMIAKGILEKKGVRIVGAVDIAKDLLGKDLGEILELDKTLEVTVADDVDKLLEKVKADIAVIMTVSHLKGVFHQVASCVKAGINVISTCEELSYPYYKHPELASQIDALAKKYGVTVLGTGINPGYLMDTLPIALTGACQRVEGIKVTRMMDSSKRRIPYQKKIGTGLTSEEFRKMIEEKKITGHVGLVESIAMIAATLGWKLDEIKELPPEPVIAEREIVTSYTTVKPNGVAGLKSVAHGIRDGKPIIVLEFISHAGVEEEYDAVSIEGVPKIYEKIAGGVHGDLGTVAVIVNMIPKVLNAKPGLVTMKDLPLPSSATEDLRVYLGWKKFS
jgi:4-hydroxy-tetrahydrodipicolinate reductase